MYTKHTKQLLEQAYAGKKKVIKFKTDDAVQFDDELLEELKD